MSENNRMNDHYSFSRKGWTVECDVSFDRISNRLIESPYRQAIAEFLGWLEGDRLNELVEADKTEKAAGRRKNRLHRAPEYWSVVLRARPSGDYLSVSLSVKGSGEGFERSFAEHRVWDCQRGILCPLFRVMPAFRAKKYDKWAYFIENNHLIVNQKGKTRKIDLDTVGVARQRRKNQNHKKSSSKGCAN